MCVKEESGAVGEIWVTDVGTNSFKVRNSGRSVVGFSWSVYDIVNGIDEISELLISVLESGGGSELAELLLESEEGGIGTDATSELLGLILKSETGVGIEAWIRFSGWILLKLLQEKRVNIMASQKGKPVNLALSQEVIEY